MGRGKIGECRIEAVAIMGYLRMMPALMTAAMAMGQQISPKPADRTVPVDNQLVRVVAVHAAPPRVKTRWHTHEVNRVMIYLNAGGQEVVHEGGKVETVRWKAGEVVWNPAMGLHTAEVLGPEPARIVEIELKQPASAPASGNGYRQSEGVELDNAQVRVRRVKGPATVKADSYTRRWAAIVAFTQGSGRGVEWRAAASGSWKLAAGEEAVEVVIKETIDRADVRRALDEHRRAVWVKHGWVRDPYIVPAPDGYYYYTGTTQTPGQPEELYNTGLGPKSRVGWQMQAWRSRDLVEWEPLGTPFSLEDGVWAKAKPQAFAAMPRGEWRLWAPELHWIGTRWAMVHTSPAPVRGANFALTEGASFKGPWSHPMGTAVGIRHDPSLFQDDDGTWWMIWGATEIAPLAKDLQSFAAPARTIGPAGEFTKMGHEGCLLRKIHGKYVLFGTGWSTGQMRKGSYNLYYAVADRITGPYSERKFAGRFLGHGTPFQDRRGRWWCTAFYNANVPPIPDEGIAQRDLRADAQTINQQGLTLVPMEVRMQGGELFIRAKDPRYATPGPDEAQKFSFSR